MSERTTDNMASESLLALTRIALGWVFFWAFLDKTFGLGFYWYHDAQFGTDPKNAWIQGNSPVQGFLQYGTVDKYFHDFFASIADSQVVAILYMVGLFGVGLTMLLGAGRKIGGVGGAILMVLMWLSELPLENNPFVDEHIIYALLLLVFAFTPHFGRKFSLANWWEGIAPSFLH